MEVAVALDPAVVRDDGCRRPTRAPAATGRRGRRCRAHQATTGRSAASSVLNPGARLGAVRITDLAVRRYLSDVLGRHRLPRLGAGRAGRRRTRRRCRAAPRPTSAVATSETTSSHAGRGWPGTASRACRRCGRSGRGPPSPPARRARCRPRPARRRPYRCAVLVAHDPLTHQRERAVREWGEVTGAAERAELVHDRGDAGVQHRDVRGEGLLADAVRRWPASRCVAASAPRTTSRSTSGRTRPRASGPASAAAGGASRPGCAGGQGPEAGGDAVVRLGAVGQAADDLACAAPRPATPRPGRPGRRGRRPAPPRRWSAGRYRG